MKVRLTTIWEIDVTDWYEDERLTKQEKINKLAEDLSDISVFCNHTTYENLVETDVEVIGENGDKNWRHIRFRSGRNRHPIGR